MCGAQRTSWTLVACLACLKITSPQLLIPKPDTVFVPVPFDQLGNIRWCADPDRMVSTCGTYDAYKSEAIGKVAGRWYTMYMSNVPTTTDHCAQFTNIQQPCGCIGIDFTTALKEGVISFVMFSSNPSRQTATYEMATAIMNGRNQLNFDKIIMRSFVLDSQAKIAGTGGYIIPNGVVVDSDEFKSYMIILFCAEEGKQPVVMVLINALPMQSVTKTTVVNYLTENNLNTNLKKINHRNCEYAQNLVGY